PAENTAEDIHLFGNVVAAVEHWITNDGDIDHRAAAEAWRRLARKFQRRWQLRSIDRLNFENRCIPVRMDELRFDYFKPFTRRSRSRIVADFILRVEDSSAVCEKGQILRSGADTLNENAGDVSIRHQQSIADEETCSAVRCSLQLGNVDTADRRQGRAYELTIIREPFPTG